MLSERETVELLRDGRSLSRFGDGEIKLALGIGDAPGQVPDKVLSRRLREVAASTLDSLVVAIPNIWDGIPRHMRESWRRWLKPKRAALWQPGRTYGSAFVSRPDFWGEPFGPDYWRQMRAIWDGRPMLLVRGSEKRPALLDNAASIEVLEAPNRDAWASYHDVLAKCLEWAERHENGIVVAQLGPTATVLAHDLAVHGVQCLDLGKADRAYRKEMVG